MPANSPDTPRIIWSTGVSVVEPDLLFRGYPVEDLMKSSTFMETAFLLVTGELPHDEQRADWQALLLGALILPDKIASWLQRVPSTASPMDVLSGVLTRTRLAEGPPAPATAQDLLDGLPVWLGFVTAVVTGRVRRMRNEALVEPRDDLGFASNLWWMLQGREPSPLIERALESLLILGADHGLASSTTAVRLAAAAGADFPSALQAAASVSMSWQPVGQAEATLDILGEVRSVDRARSWVHQRVAQGLPVAGFEHRVYRVGDPRTDWLSPLCRAIAERTGKQEREALASAIEGAVWDERQKLPGVIWPAARLLDYLGIDRTLFGPLYFLSRMAGWAAHYIEQRSRDSAVSTSVQYTGPALRHLSNSPEREAP